MKKLCAAVLLSTVIAVFSACGNSDMNGNGTGTGAGNTVVPDNSITSRSGAGTDDGIVNDNNSPVQ